MKKLSFILLAAVALLTSCHKDILADIDSLKTDVNDLQTRIEHLEEQCKQMNTNIASLQTIVTAIQQNDMIATLTPIISGSDTTGYTLTFLSGTAITIHNGEKGNDAVAPIIGVRQDTDGIYYWTLDGEFLLADGNKIPVNGTNGITPQLKIDPSDGYWYLSLNGTDWQQLLYATGDTGKQGDTGEPGNPGTQMFQSVTSDENYIYLTLADGTSLALRHTANTYTLIYNANGGTGTMDTVSYSKQQVVTVQANAFTRTNCSFVSWNTRPDGTGATCAAGDEIVMSKNITLYAQWESAYAFSVSATKKVFFATGNLQYQASTNTWRFAEHQYDKASSTDNTSISSTYDGWIDLFSWGTGDAPTKYALPYSLYHTFTDWGNNTIGSYTPNTWRTLSADEWDYLINTRTNSTTLYAFATVNSVEGLILLPDAWTTPTGITLTAGLQEYTTNVYDVTQWTTLEAVGAVFLPACGQRDDEPSVYGTNIGYYWTNTQYTNPDFAYRLHFQGTSGTAVNTETDMSIKGHSVRLAQDL